MDRTEKLSPADRRTIAALVAFAMCFRLMTVMMINTGVDERDYWQSARAIAQGLPYPDLSHRTTRFAVILPVAAAQAVLGSHPNVYYVLPILNSMVHAGLAFAVGFRLRGRLSAFLASLSLVLFPYMIRAGSQVRPEIFSVSYMLAAAYCFIRYMDRKNQGLRPLLWTGFWLFVAYSAKITNLYFAPGLFFAVLFLKRRPAHAFILAGFVLALFLIETGAYAAFTPYKLGQLEIISQKHFHADSFTVPSLIGLLGRYAPDRLQAYWTLPMLAFAASSAWYFVKGKDKTVKALCLAAYAFVFFITIAVKSLNPITPAESFINRYFTAVLVPMFLVLAYLAEGLVARVAGGRFFAAASSPRLHQASLALGLMAAAALFSLPAFPARLREYAHSPLRPSEHPFSLNERYREAVNRAWSDGVTIVAGPRNAGSNAAWTCSAFFLSIEHFKGGRAPAPRFIAADGGGFHVIGGAEDPFAGEVYLAARRSPFRVRLIGRDSLASLAEADGDGDDE